ncbi:MAG: hypothetical protein H6739_00210 [Alphaproteobacteria bacterium]|nr:hypothetical protein [Alphaproteobacteria bacterium]
MIAVLLLGLLVGCPAEMLGVELPKGGAESISQEDLQRDVWALVALGDRHPGRPAYDEGLAIIEQRLDQMKTLPAFGDGATRPAGAGRNLCMQKDGRSGRALVVAALDQDNGADRSASSIAALISLAKAYDLPGKPEHTLVFCVWPEPDGLDAYLRAPAVPLEHTTAVLTLGPLSGSEELRPVETQISYGGGKLRHLHLQSSAEPYHGTPDDRMERLDFRVLLQRVQRLHQAVENLMFR